MKKKCFFEKLSKKVRSQSGTAAILTLSLILVLMALGTISLAASALNVRMSSKAMEWSEDFYLLDSQAEDLVFKIDNILLDVERNARSYVMNRLDREDPTALTGLLTETYNMETSGAQEFFNEYYKSDWTYGAPGSEIEFSLQDYEDYFVAGNLESISKSYDPTVPIPLTPSEAYTQDLKLYVSELFDRVYFHMLARKFEMLNNTDSDFTNKYIVLKGFGADYGVPEPDQADRCTYTYWNIHTGIGGGSMTLEDIWTYITPSNDTLGMYISVGDSIGDDPKKVNIELNVIRPDYETIEKSIKTPIFGNPIWANALSVHGGITVNNGSSVRIFGDIYASDAYGIGGISVEEGANASVRGNVYTAGNLQIKQHPTLNGGNFRIFTKVTDPDSEVVSYNNKIKIFGNEYFHDTAFNNRINDFTDYTPDKDASVRNIPFIFKDAVDTGNVYCESLQVEEGVSGAILTVDGNLWTRDDVQMDGNNSNINIGDVYLVNPLDPSSAKRPRYSYIGLNSDSSLTDPNASSSVINNYPFASDGVTDNSMIKINSNFVVPGVAFYNFYDFTDPINPVNDFYKSAESITSRTSNPAPTISAYIYKGGGGVHRVFFNEHHEEFDLVNDETIATQKRDALVNYIDELRTATGEGILTNVYTDITDPDGYVAGVALVQPDPVSSARAYTYNPNPLWSATSLPQASANFTAFTNLSNEASSNFALMNIFYAKTKKLGTYDASDIYHPTTHETISVCDFNDFIDTSVSVTSSEMIKLPANSTLNVTGSTPGIVYCDGDLTITGSGGAEIRGAVICKGNLTIQGNVKIVYDESVILKKLKKSANVRLFFKRGEMGEKLDELIETSTTSGRRIVNRYKILSWKEVAV